MRVLVACEFSGIVRDAFARLGHKAFSCDLLPTESKYYVLGGHYQQDVLSILNEGWDLMIAHPSCTYLSRSGTQWLHRVPAKPKPNVLYGPARWQALAEAAVFFNALMDANIPRIAVENPRPHKYALELIGRKWDQVIQPYDFGHGETKATCLWLKNLPPLMSTMTTQARQPRVFNESPGPDRWKNRSRTLPGIAAAMAAQWSF